MEKDDKFEFAELIKPCLLGNEVASNFYFLTKDESWEPIILLFIELNGYEILKLSTKFAKKIEKILQSSQNPSDDPKQITEKELVDYWKIKKINYKTALSMCLLLQSIWKYGRLLPKYPDYIRQLIIDHDEESPKSIKVPYDI